MEALIMEKKWVKLLEDTVKDEYGYTYKGGQVGFVRNSYTEDGVRYHVVEFPQGCNTFSEREIEVLEVSDLMTVEEAIEVIRSFEGHHTGGNYSRGEGKFQFNIKFYHWDLPNKVKKIEELGGKWQERVWSEYHFLLEQELRYFVEEDCDFSLTRLISWINSWHTAGRQGGWLVIEHVHKYSADYLLDHLYGLRDDLELEMKELTNYILQPHEVDKDRILVYIEQLTEEIESYHKEIYELAMELQWIQDKINFAIESTKHWISSEDAWELFLDGVADQVEYEVEVATETQKKVLEILGE